MKYLYRFVLLIFTLIIFVISWTFYPLIRLIGFLWTFDTYNFTHKVDWKYLFLVEKEYNYDHWGDDYYMYKSIKGFLLDKPVKLKHKHDY